MVAYQLYNLTNISASANFLEFTQNVSYSILGNYFLGLIIMLMIMGVFFFGLYGRTGNTGASFAVSCYITVVVAMLLKSINLISSEYLWVMVILTAISTFFLFMKGANN